MKIRKHRNNKLFTFTVCRIDYVPLKGALLKGKPLLEEKVTTLGKRQAIGYCWGSVKNGLLFGTDRQLTFHNVCEDAIII